MRLLKWRSTKFLLFILIIAVLLYTLNIIKLNQLLIHRKRKFELEIDNTFNYLKTNECRVPLLDPFSEEVLPFIKTPPPLVCSSSAPWVRSNLTALYVDNQLLKVYDLENLDRVKCRYVPFWRVVPEPGQSDDKVQFGSFVDFTRSVKVENEFVMVECDIDKILYYRDYHAFVPAAKVNVTERVASVDGGSRLSVVIIGLDSVSRANFHRQMPLTVQVLHEELQALEMFGYNKVGENTFPNLVPLLTGLSESQLSGECWPHADAHFDACPLVWQRFERTGYTTAFAEDASWMGIFHYMKRGFLQQPTHFYWRPFDLTAEADIGHTKKMNAHLCLGARPVYTVLLDYALKLVSSLRRVPHFALFWGSSLTHDYFNYPALGDADFAKFFTRIHQNGALENTVLIFTSDHGIRWGDITFTRQGKLEERLPFLFFVIPQWFKEKYPDAMDNLRTNARRLTTPFDVHETLVALAELGQQRRPVRRAAGRPRLR